MRSFFLYKNQHMRMLVLGFFVRNETIIPLVEVLHDKRRMCHQL